MLLILLSSCAGTAYRHIYQSNKSVCFTSGKYLLTGVFGNAPEYKKEALARQLMSFIGENLTDSIDYAFEQDFEYIPPFLFTETLTQDTQGLLRKTTDYRYVISLNAYVASDDLGDLMLGEAQVYDKSEVKIRLKIEDIILKETVYDHTVIGKTEIHENDEEIYLANSASTLLSKSLKKLLKLLQKSSI